MTWEIIPFAGVGPLRLGTERAVVHGLLGAPDSTFRRTPSAEPTDEFAKLGAQVMYDGNGVVEAVECFAPASISIKGIALLQRSSQEVVAALSAAGIAVETTDVGLAMPDLGTRLYMPDDRVTTVVVHARGLYDSSV